MDNSTSRRARRRLLAGIPVLTLAISLMPGIASAQIRDVEAEGQRVVTNTQLSQGAAVSAATLAPPAVLRVEALMDADALLSANSAIARATANAAEAPVEDDGMTREPRPSRAAIRADAVDASGATVITGAQAVRGTSVFADAIHSGSGITVGSARRSSIALQDNVQRAEASGNDHLASLGAGAAGGLIASLQASDAASGVSATLSGVASLRVDRATDSILTLTGNLQRASASTNVADLRLTATGGAGSSVVGAEASRVDTFAVEASADNLLVSSQQALGRTVATTGQPALSSGLLLLVGQMEGGIASIDGNDRVALGTGNNVLTTMEVEASMIGGAGGKAAILTAQHLGGQVAATVTGGNQAHLLDQIDRSSISVSDNAVVASASGNTSDAALRIHGSTLSSSGDFAPGPVGTALVRDDGATSTSAAFATHVDQRVGEVAIDASIGGGATIVQLDGLADASLIDMSGNAQAATATANRLTSLVAIDSATFASSADLLSNQMSDADVRATNGTASAPAGATIATGPGVRDSRLSIRGNLVSSAAAGNRSENRLALVAGSVFDGGSHDRARAGALGDGFGASATLALASVQRVGHRDHQPLIASETAGRFSVSGNGAVKRSSMRVIDNHQLSTATANSAVSMVMLDAAAIGDAGAALASSQYGEAIVRATSVMRVVAPGTARNSVVELGGNSNRAIATVNEAENRLTARGPVAQGQPLARLDVDLLGSADAQGDHVLASNQFAAGTVSASASTTLGGASTGDASQPDLTGGSFWIRENTSASEAAGNRAINALALDASASGGLASSQMNIADVAAATTAPILFEDPRFDGGVFGASVRLDGNNASALARGNFADNSLVVEGVGHSGRSASSGTDRLSAVAIAPIALANAQANYGAVAALVSGSDLRMPLNGTNSPVEAADLRIGGNVASAVAFGNGAANQVMQPAWMQGVSLVSTQVNHGPVQARVASSGASVNLGEVRQSGLSLTNNSVAAHATGNVSTNVVGILR